MIGAGRKRMLSLAAREANIINVSFSMESGTWDREASATGTAKATAAKMRWLREAAGDRWDEIGLGVPVFAAELTANPQRAAERIGARYGLAPEDVPGCPHFLIGTADAIVDELQRRRGEHGFSYVIFSRDVHEVMTPVVARLTGK